MELVQQIYVSALVGKNEQDLKSILESAIRHNQLNGITGMLLYHDGGFIQVLEGGAAEVKVTYARICDDKRHHHVTTLTVMKVEHRHFERWCMGFKNLSASEIAKFPHGALIFDYRKQADAIKAHPGLALELLTQFSKTA